MKFKIFAIAVLSAFFGCNDTQNTSEKPSFEFENSQKESVEQLDTAHKIANANGFENWNDVNTIAFTFNVDRNGEHFSRSWIWQPKTGAVKMRSGDDIVNYNRSKMDSVAMKTDASLINDKYWLLAPFQIAWDEGTSFSEKQNVVAPISKDTLNQLTIVYGNDGGYTPGDAYDLFYDDNYKVREWNYRKANAPEPSLSTTWEAYKNYNGIEVSTMHKDESGSFKLYFTDITVK
ncbi:hypothetical protein [Aequorivita marina]|uniref:hypothetical protein n=1 Tax=Aequorivita marina TaxID=3073654 RepID=UPI0028741730|nr:hypothetical protein [Aequorivita sp. S2608]MDS1298295.1 hypothetical protein [Aequorivita sp. S2608]